MVPFYDDYTETKLLKQGVKILDYPFNELAEWIGSQFQVNVLNIYFDLINPDRQPRLMVVLEFDNETNVFRGGSGHPSNFNQSKQEIIANKFKELLIIHGAKRGNPIANKIYETERLFVAFDSFESAAKTEANYNIPKKEIEQLKEKFVPLNLWEIYRDWEQVTFFFLTQDEVINSKKSGVLEKLNEAYYNLLSNFDEFHYYKKEVFTVDLDSKENFDTYYKGSWFYYAKR